MQALILHKNYTNGAKHMTRATKDSRLDSRTARAKLKVSGQPYYRQLDARLHLGYRKGKLGGRWVMRRRDGGRYAVETIGVADDLSDADGVEVLSYTQAQARVRTLAAQSNILGSDDASAPLRVSGAVENYLDWLDANRKAGKSARNRAANDILPLLGKLEVARLDTKDLRKWLQALAERPRRVRGKKGQVSRARVAALTEEDQRRRKSSANRTLTILKAALNRAFHEGLAASDNAWRSVKAFREADAVRLRYLSRDEAVRLVRAANEEFRPLVNAALLSGCRYGELTRLRIADFNPDRGTLHVRKSKSGKPRHIVLTLEATAFFVQLCADRDVNDLILARADGWPWGVSHQARPMLEACRGAEIRPPINFHQLRHTHASHALMDGVPLMIVARNLGHADTRMCEKHYGHLADDHVVRMIRDFSKPFGTVDENNVVALARRK